MQGEKVVAAEFLSRFNDRFYGQGLILNVPFSDVSEFTAIDGLQLVPDDYKHFAMALLCDHEAARAMWHSDSLF